MLKLDITLHMEDGTELLAKVRLPETQAFETRWGERIGQFMARAKVEAQADDADRTDLVLSVSYRWCWLAWRALVRQGLTTLDEENFMASIEAYDFREVPAASPFSPGPTPPGSSSSPSSPAPLPPPGVST